MRAYIVYDLMNMTKTHVDAISRSRAVRKAAMRDVSGLALQTRLGGVYARGQRALRDWLVVGVRS
jgi:hypothetical protein